MSTLPNALDMLKLEPEAFMLEVSRAISQKPWRHEVESDFKGWGKCSCCHVKWSSYAEWCESGKKTSCPVPPPLTESPEQIAKSLLKRVRDEMCAVAFWTAAVKLFPVMDQGDPLDLIAVMLATHKQIAACLVALGKWRIE